MRYVLDASVAVECLLRTRLGMHAASTIEDAALFAPELIDVEVMAVLRREALGGRLDEERAREALEDLAYWDVERLHHADLARDAWAFRHNASAYDAFYLAAAVCTDAALLTADGPLSRISLRGVVVQNLKTG